MGKMLCIIPARGGSKRIPRKNIIPLNGKPLVAYTIEAAVASRCFCDVYVSTDDDSIQTVAVQYGAKVDKRPTNLCSDTTKAVEVVFEFINRKENSNQWDDVAMCLPTCPFRTMEDVKNAVDIYLANKKKCPRLVGVTKCDFPPQLALRALTEEPIIDMREPEAYGFSTRSQDCEVLYYPNGSIYISSIGVFFKNRTFFGRPMLSYPMPPERSFDIDYPYQFRIAELMMQETNNDTSGER